MEITVFTFDSFTNEPFKGNPAAVCPLTQELQDEVYQKIAAEMNLSETAFITRLHPTDDFTSGARFRLRWFTPASEVPLCGHATLASAAMLFYKKKNSNSTVVFETLSGELYVRQQGDLIVMDFPLEKPIPQVAKDFKDLIKATVGDHPVQEVFFCTTIKEILICLDDTCDRSALTSLQPNHTALLASESSGKVMGVTVTVRGDPECQAGYDFFSRNFAPWYGIPEDPVTGSSHTFLASYWSAKLGKKKMLAYQCSSRGGELRLEVRDDGRVDIAGQAVMILEGTLSL
ncbi:phenazine biosynthesis-like domain-containing protein 1 [Osmerus mordax]|uniref:phenazine biosynthesis-like domain-containing protein 1 n=1 Tax=Osmerus mordax TaxID=8014 RepID=UPI003510BB02